MIILKSTEDLFRWRKQIETDKIIGFIPTMGALHEGHLSLVRKSLLESDMSIVSVFLNPKQFSKGEDLDAYPINVEEDLEKLKLLKIDAVFFPQDNDIYSEDDNFIVQENKFSLFLEGKSRPQYFPGVLTVVAKLFNMIRPDNVYFGKKDAQQLILIKKLVEYMKYPICVVPCDTVREHHGLAMSSRNEYLNTSDRGRAKIIYLSLLEAKKMLDKGETQYNIIKNKIESILRIEPDINIDYISIANSETLDEYDEIIRGKILISVAVFFCGVRLIDNIFYNN